MKKNHVKTMAILQERSIHEQESSVLRIYLSCKGLEWNAG